MKSFFLSFLLSVSAGFIAGHASEKPLVATNSAKTLPANGFAENKGQFHNQFGMPNPEILYMAEFGGMKVQLRNTGFSYILYHTIILQNPVVNAISFLEE